MRVFFALPLGLVLTEECLTIIHLIKQHKHLEEIHWTQRDHLHITLRFIADLNPTLLPALIENVNAILTSCKTIKLESRRLVLFPARNPHILSLSIHLNENLAILYRHLNEAAEKIGLTPEQRPFTPHITLGRFKNPLIKDHLPIIARPSVSTETQTLKLYQSEPNDQGSVYTELQTFIIS